MSRLRHHGTNTGRVADVVVHGPELIGPTTMLVGAHPLEPGFWFPTHTHAHPQILWTSRGVLAVAACDQRWVLPPTRALWVPRGMVHRTRSSRGALVHSVYVSASHAPEEWHRPTLLAVRPLLAELIRHLACEDLPTEQRTRAEAVLLDLLDPLPSAPLEVRMPTDPRATAVAQALHDNPADDRSLAAFAQSASTSPRTLSRLFITETSLSFDRWRTGIRMWAALPLLADGEPVARVAHLVGYATASAFLAAFRRTVGMPPRSYIAQVGRN